MAAISKNDVLGYEKIDKSSLTTSFLQLLILNDARVYRQDNKIKDKKLLSLKWNEICISTAVRS